jgi:AcrR family transcriptional regulator
MAKRAQKQGYHHGDLRRALLSAAIPLLRKGGPEALTMRALARMAGVSPMAPYRHFTDRAALVAAVADEGFKRLHARLRAAAESPAKTLGKPQQTPRAGLQAIAVAYVEFALEHPEEYRVMFSNELAADPKIAPASRNDVFAFLREGIAMLQRQKLVRAGDPQAMALTAWALVHGLVMLALDGQVRGKGAPSTEELTLIATNLLMFGMAE